MAEISAQLAAYTGLVESARANNRQGLAVGSAYLREASWLMQSTLLPGAERIYTDNLAAVDEDQRAVGSTPILGLVLLVLVLLAIGVGSLMLTRRTNRQFNLGLVIAAAVVLLVIGWIVAATRLAASSIENSRAEGTARFEQLAEARILAQQARTDETLQLIARGDITASEKSFNGRIDDLARTWARGIRRGATVSEMDCQPPRSRWRRTSAATTPPRSRRRSAPTPTHRPRSSASSNPALRDEIEQTRTTLRGHVSAAGTWLAWSPTGTLVLMVVAAAAVVVGLWPRLKEFL